MLRNRAPFLIAFASLVLAGCDGDSSGPGPAAEGSVVFSYSGAATGSYNATGRFNRVRPDEGTFAVGGRGEVETGEDALVVYAHKAREDQLFDEFLLSVENPRLGTVTCGADDADCPFGAFFIVGADVEGDSEMIWSSVSGTMNITSINEDRARGVFTLRLEGFLSDEPQVVQVTSGTFDVPIVSNVN